MRTILIKETELVQMRGMGWDSKRIATHYGITTSEVTDALEHFGLAKYRSTKKEYMIEYKRDLPVLTSRAEQPVEAHSMN